MARARDGIAVLLRNAPVSCWIASASSPRHGRAGWRRKRQPCNTGKAKGRTVRLGLGLGLTRSREFLYLSNRLQVFGTEGRVREERG